MCLLTPLVTLQVKTRIKSLWSKIFKMRFQVPQFIEVEDKIFGPLTFKQFVYLAGGAGICVILFTFLPKFLAFLIALPIAIFAAALAFYRVNDKPFIGLVEAFFNYSLGNKLYIWKKE